MDKSILHLLDKTISRYDHYFESVNTKSAFIIGLNTFLLGSIVLKSSDLLSKMHFNILKLLVIVAIAVAFVGICAALYYCFKAVEPYLDSGNVDHDYQTLLFFGSVSKMDRDDYLTKVKKLNEETLIEDLSKQAHTLSAGLTDKFKNIRKCFKIIFWFELLPIIIIVPTLSLDWLIFKISTIL